MTEGVQELAGTVSVGEILAYLQQDRYMSKSGSAAYLDMSVRTIERRLDEIPHYKVHGKVLFRRSELDLWMDRHRVGNEHAHLNRIADDAVAAVLGGGS